MHAMIFVILLRVVAALIGTVMRHARKTKKEPVCNECAFAHIQFGSYGRRSISCTFGGVVRPMKLDVLHCTDYRTRVAPVRPAIGFV